MIHILWEFEVRADRVDEFWRHYSIDGTWAQLFRKSAAFKETRLIRDVASPLRFVTIDTWEDRSGFEDFRRDFQSDYEALDQQCEALTQSEHLIGIFEAASLE
jgi:quinol monooxygenase YgiN